MILIMTLLFGCPQTSFVDSGANDTEPACTVFYRDADNDDHGDPLGEKVCYEQATLAGYATSADDCDDNNKEVKPGAPEVCYDGLDNNCDGAVDEDCEEQTVRPDADGDGYAAETLGDSPGVYDCNDFDAAVNPGAEELCNGTDDDCDGALDEDVVEVEWYRDADSDGFGDPENSTTACTKPSGYVEDFADCDDAKASVNPGVTERCNGVDDDCDGATDEGCSTPPVDADKDGYAASIDCNDADASIHPGATEVCDGKDQDCDGIKDEGACGTPGTDADGDGYKAGPDCDDNNASIHPGATESCNGLDDNCDGDKDEGFILKSWYKDADLDGFGDPAQKKSNCAQPSGYVADSTDCDDTAPSVKPGGSEVCNGKDDDCDGTVDEGVSRSWYRDSDGDGYGDSKDMKASCLQPSVYVEDATDCDDSLAATHPGAPEVCWNGEDDDCDGVVDDGCVRVRHDFTVRMFVKPLVDHGVKKEFWLYGRNKSTGSDAYWFAGYNPGQFLIGTSQINTSYDHYDSVRLSAYSGETWVFNGFCTGAGTGQCVDTTDRILGDASLKVSDLIEIRDVSTKPTCTTEWGIYAPMSNYWDYHIECVFP